MTEHTNYTLKWQRTVLVMEFIAVHRQSA